MEPEQLIRKTALSKHTKRSECLGRLESFCSEANLSLGGEKQGRITFGTILDKNALCTL